MTDAATSPNEAFPDASESSTSIKSGLPSLRFQHLISLRGIALAAFIAFLLSGPVPDEADIIATVLAYSLLALLALCFSGVLVGGLLLRNKLSITLLQQSSGAHLPGQKDALTAGKSESLLLKVEPLFLPPLFHLGLRIHFDADGLATLQHILIHGSKEKQYFAETIRFPHRGNWHTSGISVVFQDQLGLSSLEWKLKDPLAQRTFSVLPHHFDSHALPIVSSSTRTGDTVTDINDHRGDYFDLKPYHPSDGVKRILWKVYAKSGELISRHPERAMTPEGRCVVFVLASKNGDSACGACIDYLRRLEENQIEFSVGCLGMGNAPVAESIDTAQSLFIDSVWNTSALATSAVRDFNSFTTRVKGQLPDFHFSKVLIFCAQSEFANPHFLDACKAIGTSLSQENIQPVFGVTQMTRSQNVSKQADSSKFGEAIRSWLIEEAKEPSSHLPENYGEFASICGQQQWPAIIMKAIGTL